MTVQEMIEQEYRDVRVVKSGNRVCLVAMKKTGEPVCYTIASRHNGKGGYSLEQALQHFVSRPIDSGLSVGSRTTQEIMRALAMTLLTHNEDGVAEIGAPPKRKRGRKNSKRRRK